MIKHNILCLIVFCDTMCSIPRIVDFVNTQTEIFFGSCFFYIYVLQLIPLRNRPRGSSEKRGFSAVILFLFFLKGKLSMQTFEEIKTYLLQHATDFLFRVIFALLIIFVGWKLVKWLLKILDKGKLFSKLDSTVRSFLSSTVGIVLKVLLVVSAAIVLGIPESSFLTLLASGGVAVGLALQGSLSNFAGGLMLLIFKPFKEGDYIKTADNEGTVISVNVFYTVIRTFENQHITLPNGGLTNAAIVNYSAEETRRLDLRFGVAYGSDINKVREILSEIAEESRFVLEDPSPAVILDSQSDSSLDFILRCWTKKEEYWDAKNTLTEEVTKKFFEEGVEIPFPQMDIHMR